MGITITLVILGFIFGFVAGLTIPCFRDEEDGEAERRQVTCSEIGIWAERRATPEERLDWVVAGGVADEISDIRIWVCEPCGEEFIIEDGNPFEHGMNYCSHCGTFMVGLREFVGGNN